MWAASFSSGALYEGSAARNSKRAINPDLLRQLAYNEKMAELGKISAGVVHELNAPLSVIISASQMILREEGVPESVLEMIARISSEAQRLSQLTKGLLNFSSHDETVGEVDLNLTVDFILNFLNYEAARRGVIVLKQSRLYAAGYPPGRQPAEADPAQYHHERPAGHGNWRRQTDGRNHGCRNMIPVCFIIADNGPGIPAEAIDRIFDRYFTTKKPGEGTGLGLFVTKNLVENMGGEITVTSRTGGGTTFTVTLPVRQ